MNIKIWLCNEHAEIAKEDGQDVQQVNDLVLHWCSIHKCKSMTKNNPTTQFMILEIEIKLKE